MGKKFSVLSIFPEMIRTYLQYSILGKAAAKGLLSVSVHNPRDFADDRHKTVDDYPYGGGAGMVMKPEPLFRLIESTWPVRSRIRVVLLTPAGRLFTQEAAMEFAADEREIVLICGRYEAVDERVGLALADDEFSIGDYVLTGGEIPSLVIIDAVARLVPGVLGDGASAVEESFSWGLLDYPHYTRPEVFRGMAVPKVLLSGNHREIARWRKKEALKKTIRSRPDLLGSYRLTEEDEQLLLEIQEESA